MRPIRGNEILFLIKNTDFDIKFSIFGIILSKSIRVGGCPECRGGRPSVKRFSPLCPALFLRIL